jgi:hypothetical protein
MMFVDENTFVKRPPARGSLKQVKSFWRTRISSVRIKQASNPQQKIVKLKENAIKPLWTIIDYKTEARLEMHFHCVISQLLLFDSRAYFIDRIEAGPGRDGDNWKRARVKWFLKEFIMFLSLSPVEVYYGSSAVLPSLLYSISALAAVVGIFLSPLKSSLSFLFFFFFFFAFFYFN